jgi:hypothetical protein
MTLTGHVVGGQIVLDGSLVLPEGSAVRVEVVVAEKEKIESIDSESDDRQPTLAEQLKDFLSHTLDLPEDAAENHDYYLTHGLPKK